MGDAALCFYLPIRHLSVSEALRGDAVSLADPELTALLQRLTAAGWEVEDDEESRWREEPQGWARKRFARPADAVREALQVGIADGETLDWFYDEPYLGADDPHRLLTVSADSLAQLEAEPDIEPDDSPAPLGEVAARSRAGLEALKAGFNHS